MSISSLLRVELLIYRVWEVTTGKVVLAQVQGLRDWKG